MHVITADDVNGAFAEAVDLMTDPEWRDFWTQIAPRDGQVTFEFKMPVTTVYTRPWRRVLFSAVRDANPFFHLMEALWMMAGRDDAAWLSQFSSKISQYAEDNGRFHGAYGRRWRAHFWNDDSQLVRIDQLRQIGVLLRKEHGTRRAVLAMWDPTMDLGESKRDLPCNTHVYFKMRDGKLNMTVCCRSNDIILGCYGANAVHFSVLHEYMAARIEASVGTYTHVSDSWHFYENNAFIRKLQEGAKYDDRNYYDQTNGAGKRVSTIAMVNIDADIWDRDLRRFMMNEGVNDWRDATQYRDVFFTNVAVPMRDAWSCYKRGDLSTAIVRAKQIAAPDWMMACVEWLERRT